MTGPLHAEHLTAGYGDVTALRDVTVQAQPGRVTAVLGRNGAGKTTLLLTLAGILRPSSGSVRLGDRDITRTPAHKRAKLGVALVQEGKRVFKQRSVHENLLVGAWAATNPKQARKDIQRQYDLFPILADKRHEPAGSLSGGQQQMLAIAQALMARPHVLMLDEPSAGLAPAIVKQILEVVARLRAAGIAVLLVEQLVDQALSAADSVVVLDGGRVVHSCSATDPAQRDLLRSLYLGPVS